MSGMSVRLQWCIVAAIAQMFTVSTGISAQVFSADSRLPFSPENPSDAPAVTADSPSSTGNPHYSPTDRFERSRPLTLFDLVESPDSASAGATSLSGLNVTVPNASVQPFDSRPAIDPDSTSGPASRPSAPSQLENPPNLFDYVGPIDRSDGGDRPLTLFDLAEGHSAEPRPVEDTLAEASGDIGKDSGAIALPDDPKPLIDVGQTEEELELGFQPLPPLLDVAVDGSEDNSLGGFSLRIPIVQDAASIVFGDAQAFAIAGGDFDFSLGVGYRRVVAGLRSPHPWVWGIYGYIDVDRTANDNTFVQGSIGTEILHDRFEARVNGFVPFDDEETIAAQDAFVLQGVNSLRPVSLTSVERAYSGFDVEVGYRQPVSDDMSLGFYGGYFYFDADDADEISGPKGRVQYEWMNAFGLPGYRFTTGFTIRHDDIRDTNASAFVGLTIPLGEFPTERDEDADLIARSEVTDLDGDRDEQHLKGSSPVFIGRVPSATEGSDLVSQDAEEQSEDDPSSTAGVATLFSRPTRSSIITDSNRITTLTDTDIVENSDEPASTLFFVDGDSRNGTGTQQNPFTVAQATNPAVVGTDNAVFFLLDDAGDIDTAIGRNSTFQLADNQSLIGIGDGSSITILNFDISDVGRPTLFNSTRNPVITLANNNTLSGFAIDDRQGGGNSIGISGQEGEGGTFSDLQITNVAGGIALNRWGGGVTASRTTLSDSSVDGVMIEDSTGTYEIEADISNAAGDALRVQMGDAQVVLDGDILNVDGRSVTIAQTAGGSVEVRGAIDDRGLGIVVSGNSGTDIALDGPVTLDTGNESAITLSGNTDTAIAFTGPVEIDTTTGAGIDASEETGVAVTFADSTAIATTNGTGVDLNGSTGSSFEFGELSIDVGGDNRGLDLRNSDVQFQAGNTAIAGDGLSAGSIGVDLSGSTNPNGANSTTPNILLGAQSGQTAAISGVQSGVVMGDATDGSAGAYFRFGDQTTPLSGSTIATNTGGTTLDTSNLIATDPFTQGRYEFAGVEFSGGTATFEIPNPDLIFVGTNAAGLGDGSAIDDRYDAAGFLASETPASLADKTVVLINDDLANPIDLGGNSLNLGTNTRLDGFGNGNSFFNFDIPENVIVTGFDDVITDPNGAATLTNTGSNDLVNLGDNNAIANVSLDGSTSPNTVSGNGITDFTIADTTVVGGNGTDNSKAFSFVNSAGTIALNSVTLADPNGTALEIDGGTANVTIDAASSFSQAANDFPILSVEGGHSGSLVADGSMLATDGDGLQFSNADGTYDFADSTIDLAGGDAGIDIFNNSDGTFTFGTNSTITNPSGIAVRVAGGTQTVTYSGTISNTADRAIDIANTNGGSVTFNGAAIADSGSGISIDGVDGAVTVNNATLSGSDGIDIVADAGNPLTGTITLNDSAANPTAGEALNVDGTNGNVANRFIDGTIDLNNVDLDPNGAITASIQGLDDGATVDLDANSSVVATGTSSGIAIANNGAIEGSATTVTFNGSVDLGTTTQPLTGSAGLDLTDNTDTTVTFADLDIVTSGQTGIAVTDGGTLNVTTSSVAATNAPALDIDGATLNATFSSVSSINSSGFGIQLDDISGNLAMNGGAIANASGTAFDVGGNTINSGGDATIAYAGSITNSSGRSVLIQELSGGSVTLSGNITDTGEGISVQGLNNGTAAAVTFSGDLDLETGADTAIGLGNTRSNADGTVAFSGTIDVETTTGDGIAVGSGSANSGGTVSATGSGSTITTTTGIPLSVNNAVIGAGGLTFDSVTSGAGITLDTVSGGDVQMGSVALTFTTATGPGILLQTTSNNITIGSGTGTVTIANSTDDAIRIDGTSNSAIAFGDTTISGLVNTAGVAGIDVEGNNSTSTIAFGDINITGLQSNTIGLDFTNSQSQFSADSVDIAGTNSGATRFGVGVDLTGTTNSTIALGDSSNPAGDTPSAIDNVAIGVRVDTANATFTFGDGEDTVDTASTITDATTAVSTTGLNPANGTYNFLDVDAATGFSGSGIANLQGIAVYYVDADGDGDGSLANPGSVAGAEAATADAIALVNTNTTSADTIDATSAAQGSNTTLNLDDGQALVSFATSDTIDLTTLGFSGSAPANILTGLGGSSTITNPTPGIAPTLSSTSAATVELGGSSAIVGVRLSNAIGDALAANWSAAETVAIANSTFTGGTSGDGIDLSSTPTSTLTQFSNNTVTGAGADAIALNTIAFDADTSTASTQTVNAGSTSLTASGGLDFTNVSGAVNFGSGSTVTASNGGISVTGSSVDITLGTIDINGGTSPGIDIDTYTGTFTATNTQVDGVTGDGIEVSNSSSGTFNFGDTDIGQTVPPNGGGVDLGTGNTGASFTFNSLDIANTNGTGLLANGSTLTVNGAANTIATTNGAALDLANVNLGGGATFASLSSSNSGTTGITLNNVTENVAVNGGTIANSAGDAVAISGGNNTIAIASAITNSSQNSVDVSNRTGGSVTLSGTITDTNGQGIAISNNSGGTTTISGSSVALNTGANTAVNLTNNTGHSINFTNGGLDIDTTTGIGFNATGGGTVTVQGTGNSINTNGPAAAALNVANTTIGAASLTFDSISANGTTNGIVLNNTGTSGGLIVTGDSGSAQNASGGTILNTTGDAIALTNTANVQLDQLAVNGTGRHGIFGSGVNNLTVTNSTFNTIGNADEENAFDFEAGVGSGAAAISGTLTLNNVDVTNVFDTGLLVRNESGSLTIDIDNTDFSNNDDTFGVSAIFVETAGTANLVLDVNGGVFDNIESDAVLVQAGSSGTNDVNIRNITSTNGGGPDDFPNGGGLELVVTNGATLTFDIQGNTITDIRGDALIIASPTGTNGGGNLEGRVGGPNAADSNTFSGSSLGDGIQLLLEGPSTGSPARNFTILIQNNDIGVDNTGGGFNGLEDDGIQILHRDNAGTLNLTIDNNTIANTFSEGIRFFSDQDIGLGAGVPINNLQITNNRFSNTGTGGFADDVEIRTRDTARACSNVSGNNNGSGGSPGTINFSIGGTSSQEITQASTVALSTANNGATITGDTPSTSGSCTTVTQPSNP